LEFGLLGFALHFSFLRLGFQDFDLVFGKP
jgi:hypothetical protein